MDYVTRAAQALRTHRISASCQQIAMWCKHCHQDVPLRQGGAVGIATCARCGTALDEIEAPELDACAAYLSEDSPEAFDEAAASPAAAASDFDNTALEQLLAGPPLPKEDWQLEAELRDVNRLVERLRRTTPLEPAASPAPATIPFPSFAAAPLPSAMTRMQALAATGPTVAKPAEKSGFAAWMLLSLGLATFVCGSVLLGWSFLADRADLWSLGLPLTLAGQAGLILGLILQLEGLWRSTRQTDETLSELDGQLHQLRHATTMLSTTHSSPAQSFYAHMADGAHPQLLLADLKGQLDLLAQQMAASQRRSA